jgi:hypothetical protein
MAIIRRHAVQGHWVPATAAPAYGPFPPELYAANPKAEEPEYHGDSLHEALDDVRFFRCKDCKDIMYEYMMDDHICEDDEYAE